MVLLEFDRDQVVQALVRTHSIVVPAPCLDENAGFATTAKPLETQTLVAQLAVERLVRSVLPRLSGMDHRGVDAIVREPLQNRLADELGTAIGTQIRWGTVQANQPCEHIDDSPRADRASDVDGQALMREFVDDRQALDLLPIGTGVSFPSG